MVVRMGRVAALHGHRSSSPELTSGRTEARQLMFSSSKRSGGQGDPYTKVLRGELGS
jgi:hypothetical protein